MPPFKTVIKNIALLILLGTTVMLTYTVIHELGHLLAAKAFGAKIIKVDFNILSAKIMYDGQNLTGLQQSIIAAAGGLFPLLVSITVLYSIKKASLFSIASLILYISCLFSLLSSIIPMDDLDTLNFIRHSGFSQATVSAIYSVLFLVGLWILFSKRIRGKATTLLTLLKEGYFVKNTAQYIKRIIVLVGLIAALIILGNISLP